MTCDRCGRRTANRNVCVECAREERQEERARLEGTGALTFETIKVCHDCRATSDNVDGEYLEDNPGVWKCDDCREDDPEAGALVADGGVIEYDCPECGVVRSCDVDEIGQRRCPDCERAVTAVATDGGHEPRDCRHCGRSMGVIDSEPTNPPTTPRNDALWKCPGCGHTLRAVEHEDRIATYWEQSLADEHDERLKTDGGRDESITVSDIDFDELAKCVNHARDLTWFYGHDDGGVYRYHEIDDFEPKKVSPAHANLSLDADTVRVEIVSRTVLHNVRASNGGESA